MNDGWSQKVGRGRGYRKQQRTRAESREQIGEKGEEGGERREERGEKKEERGERKYERGGK